MITAAQIKKVCPKANSTLVKTIVDNWSIADAAGIKGPLRVAHFFAQIATETGGLTSVSENLNYSPSGLMSTFGRHRISEADAKKYGRTAAHKADQKAIANIIYGGEWGLKNLGNTEPNDGWDMRGGGMMQTTGRSNYAKLGFENNPQALRDPLTAFQTAVREWVKRGCNALADKDDVTAIRKAINGGTNGLAEAKAYLKKAKSAFADAAAKPQVVSSVSTAPKPAKELTGKDLIKQVQTLLRSKGYPEVGDPDGLYGNRTRNAILAFQADNALPLTGVVTDDVLAALVKAPVREQSAARATATAEDLKAKEVPTVKVGDQLQKVGQGFMGTMGLGALAQGTADFSEIKDKLDSLKGLYDTVISFSPWIIGAIVAGVAIYFGGRVIRAQVAAYRAGHSV